MFRGVEIPRIRGPGIGSWHYLRRHLRAILEIRPAQIRVPHPRRAFVFAARVGVAAQEPTAMSEAAPTPATSAPPQVATIATLGQHEGQSVTLRGWLYNLRESGKLLFPIFRDGTGTVQGVAHIKSVPAP